MRYPHTRSLLVLPRRTYILSLHMFYAAPMRTLTMLYLHLYCSEEVSKERLNALRGLTNHQRIDEELYHDFESEEARKVSVRDRP